MSVDRDQLLDEHAVERVLAGHPAAVDAALLSTVDRIRSLAEGPAPRPTAVLAQMLETGFAPPVLAPRRPATPRPRWTARAAGVLAAVGASVLVAGIAHALPPALQNSVADLVSALTPWELPRPEYEQPEPAGEPPPVEDTAPAIAPEPSGRPSPSTASAVPPVEQPGGNAGPVAGPSAPAIAQQQHGEEPAEQEAPEQEAPEQAEPSAAEPSEQSDDASDSDSESEQSESEDGEG